ncbi:MAG: hypothetical protein OXB88_06805 [Bacteriovoracales bacterium]|nr:hypothetical protein [Bacteriovoracales bacterium]
MRLNHILILAAILSTPQAFPYGTAHGIDRSGPHELPHRYPPHPRTTPQCPQGQNSYELCLQNNRFGARLSYLANGSWRRAHPIRESLSVGYFWFLSRENIEATVKFLYFPNQKTFRPYWDVLSDLPVRLEIRDYKTGKVSRLRRHGKKPSCSQNNSPVTESTSDLGPCQKGRHSLCLGGETGKRFALDVRWKVPARQQQGKGYAQNLDSQNINSHYKGTTGKFWFFSPTNTELLVKILEKESNHFEIAYAVMTDLEFELRVRDTRTGIVKTYKNFPGTSCGKKDILTSPSTDNGTPPDEGNIPGVFHSGCSPTNKLYSPLVPRRGTYTKLDLRFDVDISGYVPGGQKKHSLVWASKNKRHSNLFGKIMLTDLGRRQLLTLRQGIGQKHGNKEKFIRQLSMPPGRYSIHYTYDMGRSLWALRIFDSSSRRTFSGQRTVATFRGVPNVRSISFNGREALTMTFGHRTDGSLGPNEVCVDGWVWRNLRVGLE